MSTQLVIIFSFVFYVPFVHASSKPEVYQAIGCENLWLDLHCPDGMLIRLSNARYGRFSVKECPEPLKNWPGGNDSSICYSIDNSPTSQPWVKLLSNRCNGRQSCMSFVTYWIAEFHNTMSEYVEANYTCVSSNEYTSKPSCLPKHENCWRTFAPTGRRLPCCDGMMCELGRCIDCRYKGEACTEHLECCGDGNYCVNNVCVHGTPKALGLKLLQGDASLVMEIEGGKSVRSCEEQFMDLSCPKGQVIEVLAAAFGRWSGKICTHGHEAWAIEPIFDNRWCNNEETNSKWTAYMQKECNGQQHCMIRSSNHVAGDPCGGTYKYTEARYQCISSSQERPSCLPLRQDCQRDFLPLGKPLRCCDGMSCERGVCVVCKNIGDSCADSIECCGNDIYCMKGKCKKMSNPPMLYNMCTPKEGDPVCT